MASTQSARIEIDALAKVNLYLHITGRRDDGFHELDSLFVRVDSGDRLKLAAADGLNLDIDGPFAPALSAKEVGDNLVLTAARRLACHLDREPGAAIHLQKNLPVAAGLGGGSADAASTLLGLRMLWRAEIPDDRLRAIAAELGADVPACLAHHPLQVAGIGERLVPAPDLPPAWLVLVNPGIELSTADVFRRFAGGFSRAMPLDGAPANVETLADVLRARRNDLEPAAMGLVPEIADVLATLSGEPHMLLARMSGSGATCFGLAATAAGAAAAASRIRKARPDWWVDAAAMLTSEIVSGPLPIAERKG